MKRILSLAACACMAALALVSCKSKDAEMTVNGIVMDASMNNIVLISENGDTLNISTVEMNADSITCPAVMVTDAITVTYVTKMVDNQEVLVATSVAVVSNATEATPDKAEMVKGTWVEANPIDAAQVQGFTLNEDGSAASVNMATLQINKWMVNGDTLTLNTVSMGNGQNIEGAEAYMIEKADADSLVLVSATQTWRLARQK